MNTLAVAEPTPITTTDDDIVGRRVRFYQHSGDPVLRGDYTALGLKEYDGGNEQDSQAVGESCIGAEGVIIRLETHYSIASADDEPHNDRWIDVKMDDGTEQTFWRDELLLI